MRALALNCRLLEKASRPRRPGEQPAQTGQCYPAMPRSRPSRERDTCYSVTPWQSKHSMPSRQADSPPLYAVADITIGKQARSGAEEQSGLPETDENAWHQEGLHRPCRQQTDSKPAWISKKRKVMRLQPCRTTLHAPAHYGCLQAAFCSLIFIVLLADLAVHTPADARGGWQHSQARRAGGPTTGSRPTGFGS